MPQRGFLLATALVASLLLTPAAARSDVQYSPVQHNIETTCNALAKDPAGMRKVVLLRLHASDGTDGAWQRSDEKTQARFEGGALGAGEIATIRDFNSVLLAIVTSGAAAGAAPTTKAWCFFGGRLSRADIAFPDPDTRIVWRHAEYFQNDVDTPDSDLVYQTDILLPSHPNRAKPPMEKLALDVYPTPSKLPFYDAYRSALGSKAPAKK